MSIEEYTEGATLVVRAELPDVDPEKDIEITISAGMLDIVAERSEEPEKKGRDFHRREFRYGSFSRSIPIPEGVKEAKIRATYKDGILQVRLPLPAPATAETAHRVPVTRG
jgi:HSP20 family protein